MAMKKSKNFILDGAGVLTIFSPEKKFLTLPSFIIRGDENMPLPANTPNIWLM